MYTTPIVSLDEAPRLRYIMAQSAATDPSPMRPAEAPAPTSMTTTTVHCHPITSHAEDPLNIFLPLNPVLTIPTKGLMATLITNTPTTATSDSLLPQDLASALTEDEDDIWLAMAMTFNDLYQGLTENKVPSLEEANNTNASIDLDNGVVESGHIFASNEQVEE